MLQSDNIHLSEVESRNLDDIWKNSKTEEKVKLYSQQGSNSGGYSSFIFKQAARDLFNIENAEPVFTNVR